MIWSFVLASILIELTPGPNMTWLAVLGASRGRKVAFAAVAGIGLGLAVAGAIAGIGLTAVLTQFPVLFQALRWAGTFYLFYLAWAAWNEAGNFTGIEQDSSAKAFQQGLISNILNPKAYLFYGAMLPQFISGAMPIATEIAILSALYVTIATVIHACIAGLSGSLATVLQSSPKAIVVRKALALAIAGAAIWFFFSTKVVS